MLTLKHTILLPLEHLVQVLELFFQYLTIHFHRLKDAVLTVRKRGLLMEEAVPAGVGAMAAVLGMDARATCLILSTEPTEEPPNFRIFIFPCS